jgi:uncharacterized OB-fold protein
MSTVENPPSSGLVSETRTLKAPVRVSFDYTRSTGPVLGRFLTGLRDGSVVGARLSDGRVAVPPPEFDPSSHRAVEEFVEVSTAGTVVTWSWVPEPVEGQPFDRPFAWALVLLDGADTPLLHALDVSSPEDVHSGMRVQIRWASEPSGSITDIACFEGAPAGGDSPLKERQGAWPRRPQESGTTGVVSGRRAAAATEGVGAAGGPITGVVTPVNLDYMYAASPEESSFFRGLAEGKLLGQRCPVCRHVYIPPRSACPVDGVPTTDEVELADTGTVTTYCIVNVPFLGQKITPPYVSAYVLLDGADIAFLHLILGIDAADVRMGMRVKAVWKPSDEWGTTIENISHFEPTGEPDADYESYKVHL